MFTIIKHTSFEHASSFTIVRLFIGTTGVNLIKPFWFKFTSSVLKAISFRKTEK